METAGKRHGPGCPPTHFVCRSIADWQSTRAMNSLILKRFLQTEHLPGLGGSVHLLASGQDLRAGSCPRSRRCGDCGAFSSAANRARNRIQQREAADILGGPLILTDDVALFVTQAGIIRCYRIPLPTRPPPQSTRDTHFKIAPNHSLVSSILLIPLNEAQLLWGRSRSEPPRRAGRFEW